MKQLVMTVFALGFMFIVGCDDEYITTSPAIMDSQPDFQIYKKGLLLQPFFYTYNRYTMLSLFLLTPGWLLSQKVHNLFSTNGVSQTGL